MAFLGQHHVGGGQDGAQFLVADDPALFGIEDAFFAAGKIAAVMHDTDIIGINVVRRPVQTGQLTEIGVALRDILARIIADITAGRVDGMAHLHRQIHRIVRHPVRLMCCYNDRCLQSGLPASLQYGRAFVHAAFPYLYTFFFNFSIILKT